MNPIAITGVESPTVAITPTAAKNREVLLGLCVEIKSVESDRDAEKSGAVLVDLAGLIKEVEKARKAIKQPVLDLCRLIDSTAESYSSDLEKQSQRIRGLVAAYTSRIEEQRRAEERKRQEELARIERERLEHERRQREEIERIERERVEAENEARRKFEQEARAAKTKADIDAALARQEEHSKQLAEQAAEASKKAAVEAERAAMRAEQAKASVAQVDTAKPAQVSGVSVLSVWKFEVVNVDALHRSNPALVTLTPKSREINAAIASGARNIPGLIIWEEKGVKVRA